MLNMKVVECSFVEYANMYYGYGVVIMIIFVVVQAVKIPLGRMELVVRHSCREDVFLCNKLFPKFIS